jgi:hypothetical protein
MEEVLLTEVENRVELMVQAFKCHTLSKATKSNLQVVVGPGPVLVDRCLWWPTVTGVRATPGRSFPEAAIIPSFAPVQ